LRYGRIVWASVKDPRGFEKERPAIVLTPTDRIAEGAPLVVMAITTTFSNPPPEWHVPLPWNADPRRVKTRLAQRSAAVVNWLDVIPQASVIAVRGDVPPAVMRRIEQLLQDLQGRSPRSGG